MDNVVVSLSQLMNPNHTAVVTGASSGIGRAACLAFAKAGMHVFMIDVDEKELSYAQAMVKSMSLNQKTQIVVAETIDVSNIKFMESLVEQVFDGTGCCHVLFNNAGIGLGGGATSTPIAIFDKVMRVNMYGPVHGCLAFVDRMKTSGEPGIIINTGSKQGITCPPGNLTYNISKAALKVYTEGLEHELMLERLEKRGKLRAVLLIPGWVNTSIALKAQRANAVEQGKTLDVETVLFHEDKPHAGAWMPSQVIEYMIEQVDQGAFYVICPDNEVDRETDQLRMMWTASDIAENRPPLSRWHPDYKDQFTAYVHARKLSK